MAKQKSAVYVTNKERKRDIMRDSTQRDIYVVCKVSNVAYSDTPNNKRR